MHLAACLLLPSATSCTQSRALFSRSYKSVRLVSIVCDPGRHVCEGPTVVVNTRLNSMASHSDRTLLFAASGDGTADFGGSILPQTSQSHATLPDVSLISYSDNLAITQTSDIQSFTKPAGVTSSSYRDWDLQRTKHARLTMSPQLRHSQPVTTSMEYGWQTWGPSTTKRFGKVKCAETKIVDAQILGPRHVDVICPSTKMYL